MNKINSSSSGIRKRKHRAGKQRRERAQLAKLLTEIHIIDNKTKLVPERNPKSFSDLTTSEKNTFADFSKYFELILENATRFIQSKVQ